MVAIMTSKQSPLSNEEIQGELLLEIRDIARITNLKASDISAGIINGTISVPTEQNGPRTLIRRKYALSVRNQYLAAQPLVIKKQQEEDTDKPDQTIEYLLTKEAALILDLTPAAIAAAATKGKIAGKREVRPTATGERQVWLVDKRSVLAYKERTQGTKLAGIGEVPSPTPVPAPVPQAVVPQLPTPTPLAQPKAPPTVGKMTPPIRLEDQVPLKDIRRTPEEELYDSFPATLTSLDAYNYLEGLLTQPELILMAHTNSIPGTSTDRTGNLRFDKMKLRDYKMQLMKKRKKQELVAAPLEEDASMIESEQPAVISIKEEEPEQQQQKEVAEPTYYVTPKTNNAYAPAEPVRITPTLAAHTFSLMYGAGQAAIDSIPAGDQGVAEPVAIEEVDAPRMWRVKFDVDGRQMVRHVIYTGTSHVVLQEIS